MKLLPAIILSLSILAAAAILAAANRYDAWRTSDNGVTFYDRWKNLAVTREAAACMTLSPRGFDGPKLSCSL